MSPILVTAFGHALQRLKLYRLGWVGALLCAGCAVGPDFQKPAPPQVQQYTREPDERSQVRGSQAERTSAETTSAMWWRTFGSEQLNEVIEQALKKNPGIAAAQAALRQAHENTAAQFGSYFPLIAANYAASRQKNAVGTISPTLTSGDALYTLHTAQVSVSYTPDVFGLNRRQVESLQAQEDVQRFQEEAVYQTLAANLVAALIQESALQEQLRSAQDVIHTDEQALQVLNKQLTFGYVSALDVAAQESALAQAKQVLPSLLKQLEQTRDLIATLSGTAPAQLHAHAIALSDLKLQQDVPTVLPTQLLEQRPDIEAAQAQLHAVTAQVGVALANRLPQLSISAVDGGSSTQFSSMFADGNKFWSLTGGVIQPIWDFGVLKHRQNAAEAALDQAKAQYQATVLQAFQNVADCLYALKHDEQAQEAAQDVERIARRTLDLTKRQNELGAVNGLAVLTAQQTYLQARLGTIQTQASRYLDVVALYQALGGSLAAQVQTDTPQRVTANAQKP